MGTTNLGCMDVTVGVLLQRAVILAKNESRENDSLVTAGARLQILNVLFRIWCVSDDQQAISGADSLERFDYEAGIIFGLQSRDVQDVTVGLDAPLPHQFAIRPPFHFASVRDHRRWGFVPRQVIVLNDLSIG